MIIPPPMLLEERRIPPFADPGWIYEIKFDGWRLMTAVDKGVVRIVTRRGTDATKRFPELVAGLAQLKGGPHVLDGEGCVLDDMGRSDFNRFQDRARRRGWYAGADPVVFCVFDLLVQNGKSLLDLPIEKRKARLAKLLTPAPPAVMYVGHFDGDQGRQLFEHAKELQLEGLVAKRLGSVYQPGVRSPDWQKVKRKGAVPPERFKR